MKIVHVINHTHRHNGNVHAAIDLACAQARLGHSVAICSSGGDFDQVLKENNIKILTLKGGRSLGSILHNVGVVRREITTGGAQIVHAHMMESAIVARFACRTRRMMVTTVHNAFQRSSILMALADRVIAVSAAVGQLLVRRGVSKKKVRVVLNGTIGSARIPSDLPSKESLQHPAFLYVGGLHPRKGILDLMNGFSIARVTKPEFHLYIVGEGPMEHEYKELVQPNDLDNIHFCGSRADPRGFMRDADVFVLASHADPAPLVISEAREAGLAVIATRVDGIPELLEDGKAGILVAPQNPGEIAGAMQSVFETPDALQRFRAASQTNIDRMSVERVARETVKVYEELGAR